MPTKSLTLLLTLGLAACSGSQDPALAGLEALNSGNHAEALSHFDTALAEKTSADPDFYELSIDRLRAMAYQQPEAVPAGVTALAGQATVTARDYRTITTDLVSGKQFVSAVNVMDLGMKAYPDDEKMGLVKDKVIAASKAAGDAGALEALAGMGYLGGD